MAAPFIHYHARHLAIDPARPWQVISSFGVLLGQLPTEDDARRAVDALTEDQAAGRLPCNLSRWDRRHLLGAG